MSTLLITLIVSAGISLFAYSRLGRHVGYTNTNRVWSSVAIIFVVSFVIVLSLLTLVFHV